MPVLAFVDPAITPDGMRLDRIGLLDPTGRVVLEPCAIEVGTWSEGLLALRRDDRLWGFVDETGRWVIEPRWTSVSRFSEGLCAVRPSAGTPTIVIDRSGTQLFSLETRDVDLALVVFREGHCVVLRERGYGYVDREGRVAIEPRFESAQPFSGGLAAVMHEGHFGYVQPDGRWAIAPRFTRAWGFAGDLAPAVASVREVDSPWLREFKKDHGMKELRGLWGLIDRRGEWVVPPSFDYAETELATALSFVSDPWNGPLRSVEGHAIVRREKKWGLIATDGRITIPPSFSKLCPMREGLCAARKKVKGKELWGFVDAGGAFAIEPRFTVVLWPHGGFSEGLAAVGIPCEPHEIEARRSVGEFSTTKFGYVDRRGEWRIPPAFTEAAPFQHGIASARSAERVAWIDREGREVWGKPIPRVAGA